MGRQLTKGLDALLAKASRKPIWKLNILCSILDPQTRLTTPATLCERWMGIQRLDLGKDLDLYELGGVPWKELEAIVQGRWCAKVSRQCIACLQLLSLSVKCSVDLPDAKSFFREHMLHIQVFVMARAGQRFLTQVVTRSY